MDTLGQLQADLAALEAQRLRLTSVGFCLQHCWLVQVKPGGTARTNRQYWQVRSRQAILDGKKLKHLKPEEVEDYKAAIARGQQLKQIDRQIESTRQRMCQLTATASQLSNSFEASQGQKRCQTLTIPTASSQRQSESEPLTARNTLTVEQRDVPAKQLILQSRQLRALAQQSCAQIQESCAQIQESCAQSRESCAQSRESCAQSRESRAQSRESRAQSQTLQTARLRLI